MENDSEEKLLPVNLERNGTIKNLLTDWYIMFHKFLKRIRKSFGHSTIWMQFRVLPRTDILLDGEHFKCIFSSTNHLVEWISIKCCVDVT